MPKPNRQQNDRWAALLERRASETDVYYGVRTTGVVCRVGCPSRLPRREHVEFFETVKDATRAGYRPCKRCTPDTMSAGERIANTIRRACRTLESADQRPTLDRLAADAGLSPWHFHRLFKQHVGVTPAQYARGVRSTNFRAALRNGAPVTDAIYAAGFGSSSRAYADAKRAFAMSPSAVKRGAAGETIRYAVARCPLGWVIVAATERGICSIALGDTPRALPAELRRQFPKAKLEEPDDELKALVTEVVRSIEEPGFAVALPLDIRGTAFQEQVWRALQRIPAGATVTYSALAKRLGRPSATRAVASACAANKLAVAIPCHRVVGRDGSLTGYRWGVERKRSLLALEKTPRRKPGS